MKIVRPGVIESDRDSLAPGSAKLIYNGSAGDDVFTGGADKDTAFGSAGDDKLSGGGGSDFLYGGDDNDILKGEAGDDLIFGDAGDDRLEGGDGNDMLSGGAGVDLVYGNAGDDMLYGAGDGTNYGRLVDGGDGIDTAIFQTILANPVVFSLANPAVDQVVEGATIRNVERANVTTLDGNDSLTGGQYDDKFFAGFGDDVLHGGDGNDELRGEYGRDQLFGDGGDDTLYVASDQLIDGGSGVDLAIIDFTSGGGGGSGVSIDISDPSVDQNVDGAIMRNVDRLNYRGANVVNQITGGAYDDLIIGGAVNDVLKGGGGNDTVSGEGGIDQLFGGGGDDYVFSYESGDSSGDSVLDGGDGFDLLNLSLQNYSGSTTLNLADTVGSIRNFEQLTFVGSQGGNIVTGGGADDSITGGNGIDQINGVGGNDNIYAYGSADVVHGGEGNDFIDGGFGGDTLYGEAGNDSLRTNGTETNFLDGGIGNDELIGGFGIDTLIGGEGRDYLDGGAGADMMTGGVGDDLYVIDDVNDVANEQAGEGVDEIRSFLASYTLGAVFENLSGNNFSDATGQTLIGNSLNNRILGSSGNDILNGAQGGDTMWGFGGDDIFYVDSAGDVIGEFDFDGNDRLLAGTSYTLGAGVSVETLATTDNTGTAAINLTGNELANTIAGNAGANILNGAAGADVMQGLGGNDRYYVDNALDRVIEASGGGNDLLLSAVSYVLADGIFVETLATTDNAGTGAVNLTGNSLANTIVGNAGANILNGGAGADVMQGLGGNDRYYVDNVLDRVIEASGQGTDLLLTSLSYVLADAVFVESLATTDNAGTGAINLTGNSLANMIVGNAGANILNGGGGADVMQGLGGNDRYYVDNALDRVIEASGGGNDIVQSAVNYVLADGVFAETLTTTNAAATTAINLTGNNLDNGISGNAGANILNGASGNDSLVGLGGADTLQGGLGNDSLFGGLGADSLTGDAGNDLFRFDTALGGGNVDTITDFVAANDTILLDNAVFTGLAAGTLAPGAFATGTAAADADDRIIYDSTTGALLFDADGIGGVAAVQFATLSGHPPITSIDFVVT